MIRIVALSLVALYAALLAAMRFHLCLNDFWAWSFLAGHSEISDAASLQNGFMPPAYVLYLKAIGSALGPAREISGAFALSLAAVFVTAVATAKLACAGVANGRHQTWVGVLTIVLLALWPPFLQSGMTAGPDIVVAALVAIAALLHWRDEQRIRQSILAGALLGLAILVRGHALFAAIGILIAPLVLQRRFDRPALAPVLGILVALLAQTWFNLAAGVPAWSTGQAFNVYKMMYGIDWFTPVRPESISVAQLILDDPGRFLYEWAGAFRRAGQWLLGPAIALFWAWRRQSAGLLRLSLLALIAGAVYTVPVSLGDSPRTAVVIGAMLVAPLALLIAELRATGPRLLPLLLALLIGFGFVQSLRQDRAFLEHNRAQARDFEAVENLLLASGASSAIAVFSDDFDLYFRELDGARPLTRGGWGVIGIDGWEDRFPQLPTDDVPGFLAACRAHDVRYLALTSSSARLGPGFAVLRDDPRAVGVLPLGVCGQFHVLELPAGP